MTRRFPRRSLVGALALARGAAAQAPRPVVGMLSLADPAWRNTAWMQGFLARLEALGWTPGRSLGLEERYADFQPGRLPALAEELVALRPDALFVPTRPALPAMRRATTSIPTVFISLGDPVQEGWVASLARPGGNLTGVAGQSPDLAAKRVELLQALIPGLSRLALLHNPGNAGETVAIRLTQEATRAQGLALLDQPIAAAGEIAPAIARLRAAGAEAAILLPDPTFNANRALLMQTLLEARLPALAMESTFVEAGGLICFGPNLVDMFRAAAEQLDRVLRGASPATLPVLQPTRFDLVVNLKTARALGVTVPVALLARADEVIE